MYNVDSFLNYDKISDTLIYLTNDVVLRFNVNLAKKSKDNKRVPFHSEYAYTTAKYGTPQTIYSIKRNFTYYFTIDDTRDFMNNVLLRAQDVFMLLYLLNHQVLPWFMGNNRIFGFNKQNQLNIIGKYTQVEFPLNDYKYMMFLPIILTYEDGTSKEGVRMIINQQNNAVDIDINKFFEFYYTIKNTDMYNAALSMINYVKTTPYGQNLVSMDNNNPYVASHPQKGFQNYTEQSKKGKTRYMKNDFFDKLD